MVHWGRASFIAPWSRIVRRVSVVMCALWSKVTFSGGSASVQFTSFSPVQNSFVQSPHKKFQSDETEVCACNVQRATFWQIFYTPSRLLGKPRKYETIQRKMSQRATPRP